MVPLVMEMGTVRQDRWTDGQTRLLFSFSLFPIDFSIPTKVPSVFYFESYWVIEIVHVTVVLKVFPGDIMSL